MEQNFLEALMQMLGKNSQQQSPQQPPSNPYYPSDAYPKGQTMQTGLDNLQTNMLPLLLKLMSGGNGAQSPLLNMLGGSSPTSSSQQTKNTSQSDEFDVPHNDILL